MYIQSRVYKINSSKKEVQGKIARLSQHPSLEGEWLDDNTFCLQKKQFRLFKLQGNIEKIDSNKKLTIAITAGYPYLLSYLIPLTVVVYGLFQWAKDSEKGLLFVLAGLSISGFIFLIASSIADSLKKAFKEEFQII